MKTGEEAKDLDRELTELRHFLMDYDKRGVDEMDSFAIRKLESKMNRVWKQLSDYKRYLIKKK